MMIKKKETLLFIKEKLYLNSKNIIKSLGIMEKRNTKTLEKANKTFQEKKKKTEIKRKTYRANERELC